MEPGAVVACSSSMVAFSWEHQPGVSKQSPIEAKKPSGGRMPAGTKKAEAQPHRLCVPPPPGGPGAPAVSPPARSSSRSRGIRPEEDPFLAAYLACTANGRKGGRGPKAGRKLLRWTGLGLGLAISCRSSCAVVEQSVVALPKIPEVDDH